MTYDHIPSAGEHGRHFPRETTGHGANLVHAALDGAQSAGSHARPHLVDADTAGQQLTPGHDALLSRRKLLDHRVHSG